jgi:hypothetical protein
LIQLTDGLHHLPANERVASLASFLFTKRNIGMYREVYARVSPMMCWDAALYCAWAAGGIDVPSIQLQQNAREWSVLSAHKFEQIFNVDTHEVTSTRQLERLPPGCLIGFVGRLGGQPTAPEILRHAMVHIRHGLGAGTKNGCIFPASPGGGWEAVDMTEFFDGTTFNRHTRMVYVPCNGQRVYTG